MTETSKEYAVALFGLGMETDKTAEILEGLHFALKVFDETPEYYAFLDAPGIPMSERLNAVHEAFSGSVPEYVESFLCLLCSHRTAEAFPRCVEEYENLYNDRVKKAYARVVSAVELTEDEKRRLDAQLEKRTGKEVDIVFEVDPSLLGGMTVELDGVVIDGSLRRRLKTMKEVMDK